MSLASVGDAGLALSAWVVLAVGQLHPWWLTEHRFGSPPQDVSHLQFLLQKGKFFVWNCIGVSWWETDLFREVTAGTNHLMFLQTTYRKWLSRIFLTAFYFFWLCFSLHRHIMYRCQVLGECELIERGSISCEQFVLAQSWRSLS